MNQSSVLEAKWTGLIKACQASQLTVKEFANQKKIGVGSLYVWAKRLGLSLRSQDQSGINFFELGSIPTTVTVRSNTELYPVEMSVGNMTMKTEMPLIQIVTFMKEFV